MPKFFWTANLEIIRLLCNSHYCSIWITPYNIHVYLEDLMYWGDKWCVQGYTRSLRWKKAWLCLWASLASAVATGLGPRHLSFDSSYGIIYSLGSWRNFSVTEQTIHLIVFIPPEDVASCLTVLFLFFTLIPGSCVQVPCYEQHAICHWNIYACCLQCFVFPQYSCGPSGQWIYWVFTEMESAEVMQGLVLACWVNFD